jgi:hypothetical protein
MEIIAKMAIVPPVKNSEAIIKEIVKAEIAVKNHPPITEKTPVIL